MTKFLPSTTLYVTTLFNVSSLISLLICHDRDLNTMTKFFFFHLPYSLSFFMSRQNSDASSGALLMQCHDISNQMSRQYFCFQTSIVLWHSFMCCNIFLVLLLIFCRDRVVKYRDTLSTVILHFALFLLQHSFACCDKLLQVAFGFCHDNAVIMSRHNCISCLSYFFLLFLPLFVSFALKPCKT